MVQRGSSGMATRSLLIELAQYAALRGLGGLLHCFDLEQNMHTAGTVGDVYFATVKRHRERAIQHVRQSFPEWNDSKVESVARASIRNMFQLFMVESLAMPRLITADGWPRFVALNNVAPVVDLLARGEPALFVTGHCGNWEILGFTLAAIGFPMTALARPLDNRFINHWLLSVRESKGLRVLTKWGATPVMNELIRTGGRLAFIADQNAGDDGLFVPFFGRLASAYKSIGLLAMHHRVPIVAGSARRIGERFQYEIELEDLILPHEWEAAEDPLYYITARYTRAIEMMVRKAPEQYLWVHRRWKSRPRHERELKPFPARLKAKLEGLPWMTRASLEELTGSPAD